MAIVSVALKLFLLFALFLGYGVVDLEASHKIYPTLLNLNYTPPSSQPYRTAYHFQPSKNWMNDPNGPMIYKGIYHFFYQYNPNRPIWGDIVWAHSTSEDLVNWTPQPVAIYPSQLADAKGAWSGSATILPRGSPAILYTGLDVFGQQVQNLIIPTNTSDPYLAEWKKSDDNPLIEANSENDVNASAFRDPTTAWYGPDKKWRVIIGSLINGRGIAVLYTSHDFVDWVKANHPLHSAPGTGMWECPDFYPVSVDSNKGVDLSSHGDGVKYVLKVSLDDTKHDYYTIGDYDYVKDIYTPDNGSIEGDWALRYDYGKFYASKSFFDSAKNRRILWGWINESSTQDDDVQKGWSGIQGVPRVILLDKSRKQLVQWPIEEIEKLRVNPVHMPRQDLKMGSDVQVSGVTAAQADVEISFKVSNIGKAEVLNQDLAWTNPQLLCSKYNANVRGPLGPFGLQVLASKGKLEYTSVFFRIFRGQSKYVVLMCSDQTRSQYMRVRPREQEDCTDKTIYGALLDVDPHSEELSLRCLIDHSVVESFGGHGKSIITARVYPKEAINDAAKLFAFNDGSESVTITKFRAWSMKKAKIN